MVRSFKDFRLLHVELEMTIPTTINGVLARPCLVVGHGGVSDGGPLHERGDSQQRVVLGGQGARVGYVHSGGQQVMLQVG